MRLQKSVGCTIAIVGDYLPAANALYEKVAGVPYNFLEPWINREI